MTDRQALTLRAKILGAIIREARLSANKSLKNIAAVIGTTSGTLSSYEHGRKAISLPELELLAYHLDIPLPNFLFGSSTGQRQETGFNPTIMVSLRQRMVGALLRKHRTEAEMSIRALAEATSLPARRISVYERGERPIPISELEVLVAAIGQSLEDYVGLEGPIGEWITNKQAFELFLKLPTDLREFLIKPENQTYLSMARHLSELPVEKLRALAEGLLDLTL